MLEVKKLKSYGFTCNCYILSMDGKRAVAIDPGQRQCKSEAEKLGFRVEYVLLTHGHFDHIRGCREMQEAGAKIGCYRGEEELALHNNLGEVYGDGPVPPFRIDFTFQDGEEMEFCGIKFKVISTPGHTSCGACLLVEAPDHPNYAPGLIFTGDTLFAGDVGRTDGPTGREEDLQRSLKRLCALEKDYFILPGHGGGSTLFRERTSNRYIIW